MAKMDVEKFLTDLKTFLIANLSTKLTEITTDKGDSLTLKVPDSAAYFVQSMANKEAAYDPYVWIGAVDCQSLPARGAVGKIYTIHIMLVLSDEGNDPQITSRMFRYLRAFEELITQNFAGTRSDVRMDLESLVPVPLTESGSERFFKATGVELKVALA